MTAASAALRLVVTIENKNAIDHGALVFDRRDQPSPAKPGGQIDGTRGRHFIRSS